MRKTASLFFCAAAALAFSACASYEAQPISLEKESRTWLDASEDATKTFPRITFEQAQQLGLAFSPALNRARAQLAQSRDVEKESGWWEDPSVGFETKRILNTGSQPWAYTPSGSLTVPVTGLPGLEKEISAHYAEADFWTLVQAELDFRTELAELWIDFSVVEKKREIAASYLEKTRIELARLERLFEAGEISAAAMQKEADRFTATLSEKYELDTASVELRSRIVEKIGLAPRVVREWEFDAILPETVPAPTASPSPEQLAKLPKIRAALAAYAASETALKTEIRRQYPELSLSPSYEIDGNDTFEDAFTLGIGFTLPVWNRNRRNIAAAKGARNLARIDALTLWQEQFHALRRLEREQKIAETHCRERRALTQKFRTRTEKIYAEIEIGETSPTELSEAAHQNFSAQLAECDALGDFLKTRVQIRALTVNTTNIKSSPSNLEGGDREQSDAVRE